MAKSSEPFAIVPVGLIDALVQLDAAGSMVKVSPATTVLVYSVLRGVHADSSTGVCWPSHESLARRAGVSVSAARRALDVLRQVGAIDWQPRPEPGRGRGSNTYVVTRGPFVPPGTDGPVDNIARSFPQDHTGQARSFPPEQAVRSPRNAAVRSPRNDEPDPVNQTQEPHPPAHASRDHCALAEQLEEVAGRLHEQRLEHVRHPGRPAATKTAELRNEHHARAVELAALDRMYPRSVLARALLDGTPPNHLHDGFHTQQEATG